MSVRTNELTLGREFTLRVNKTDAETPVYVLLGCAKSIDYEGQKAALVANCYSGKRKIASGDDPDYTLSVSGFVFVYATGNVAANISAEELEGWMATGAIKKFQYSAPHVGDPIRTFDAFITSFSQTGTVEGLAEYSFSLTVVSTPVITDQV